MGKKEGEIRLVTIVFVDIKGDEECDEEQLLNFKKHITQYIKELVESLEGYFIPLGNRYLIIYGYPRAHENDSERAINTALYLRKKIMGRIEGIHSASGISTGEVIVSAPKNTPTQVIGDTVNIASRLATIAEKGSIICSESTYLTVKGKFEFEERGKVKIKGRSGKVQAYTILDRRKGVLRKREFQEEQFPFVGRKWEFLLIERFVSNVLSGEGGRVVFLLGEAGIGKSRLIEEIYSSTLTQSLEKMKEFQWYEGKCNKGLDTVAFQPFIEIMKSFMGERISGNPQEMRGSLLEYFEDEEDVDYIMLILGYVKEKNGISDESEKARIFNVLLRFLIEISKRFPTIYVIDDLYSADTSTLEFIEYLSGRLKKIPFLLLIISRVDESLPFWQVKENMKSLLENNAVEVKLERFTAKESKKLLYLLKGKYDIPEDIQEKAIRFSQGNPFYLEEFVRYYQQKMKVGEAEIPPTIRGLIASRVDSIDRETREVLEEASAIGYRVEREILEKITAHFDDLEVHLRKLVNSSILTDISEGKYERFYFYHPLYRDVTYKRMLKEDKKKLHMKIASGIKKHFSERIEEFYEELARHYLQAGDKENGLKYILLSARKLKRRFAYTEAINFLEQALKLIDNPQERSNILVEMAEMEVTMGLGDDALIRLQDALDIAVDADNKVKILIATGNTYEGMSEYRVAIETYEKALECAENLDFARKIPINLGLAWVYYLQGDYLNVERILRDIRTYLEKIKEPKVEEKQYLGNAYNILASSHGAVGKIESAFRLYTKSLEIYRLLGDEGGISTLYNNLSGILSSIGDFVTAIDYLKKAMDIDIKMGRLLGRAICLYNIGENYLDLYHLDKAENYYMEYLSLNERIKNILGKGYGNWGMGRVYIEKGDFDKALEYLKMSKEILEELNAQSIKLDVIFSLGELYYLVGNMDGLEGLLIKYEKEFTGIESPELLAKCYCLKSSLSMSKGDMKSTENFLMLSAAKALQGSEFSFRLEIFCRLFHLFAGSGEKIQADFYLKRAIGLIRSVEVFLEKEPEHKESFLKRPLINNILEEYQSEKGRKV